MLCFIIIIIQNFSNTESWLQNAIAACHSIIVMNFRRGELQQRLFNLSLATLILRSGEKSESHHQGAESLKCQLNHKELYFVNWIMS